MAEDHKFCPCCGEDVPTNRISREGNLELTCIYCGFVLDVSTKETVPAAECVITADDSPFIRNLLKNLLTNKGLAQTVIAVDNGLEFISALKNRLAAKKMVSLAILDLEMPTMDGITAARVMRALEDNNKSERIPILFFSSRKCDETLKERIKHFGPASYVNKGNSADPGDLADRVDQLVNYLLAKQKKNAG